MSMITSVLGTLNKKDGICGFTTSIMAYYKNRKGELKNDARDRLIATATDVEKMKYMILNFLNTLTNAEREEIEIFTRTFENFKNWSIDKYMSGKEQEKQSKENLSIALPPKIVQLFLETKFNISSTCHQGANSLVGNSIVGLAYATDTEKNLKHYIYISEKLKVYSWARKFDNLTVFNDNTGNRYTPIFFITISPKRQSLCAI